MPNGDGPIRVYLLDDHEIVRRGIRDLVSADDAIDVVGDAGSLPEMLADLDRIEVDVAVIDVRLGDDDGIDACRAAGEAHPDLIRVILTSFDDDQAKVEAAEAGASAFLLKQVRGNEIVESIRKVAAGANLLDGAEVRLAQRRLHDGDAGLIETLTERERQTLMLIGRGHTNRQIADELFVAEKTVKNYVTSMLAKLQLERRTEAAALVVRLEERDRRRFE